MNKTRNFIFTIFNLLFSSTLLFSLNIKSNDLSKDAILKTYCTLILEKRSQHQEGFALGTKIKTLNDYVYIEKLQAGDFIASIDGQVEQEVILVESAYVYYVYEILTAQGLAYAACNQMLYDEILQEWIYAKNITTHNHIRNQQVVASKRVNGLKKIYRLTTTDHTFVIENDIHSHNAFIAVANEALTIGSCVLLHPVAATIGHTISLAKSALSLSSQDKTQSVLDALQNQDIVTETRNYYETRRAQLLTLLEQYRNLKKAIFAISNQSCITNILFSNISAATINKFLIPSLDVELKYNVSEKEKLLHCREQELLSIEKEIERIQICLMLHLQDHAERFIDVINEINEAYNHLTEQLKIQIPNNNKNLASTISYNMCHTIFMLEEALSTIEQKTIFLEQLLNFYQQPCNAKILKDSTNLVDLCIQYQSELNITKNYIIKYKQLTTGLRNSFYNNLVNKGLVSQFTINEIKLEFKSKRKKKEQQKDSNSKIKQSNSSHKTPPNDPDPDDDKNKKKKRIYTEDADYHHQNSRGVKYGGKSPAPKEGQKALDKFILVKEKGPIKLETRIGVEDDRFVVFDEQAPGEFHGHLRPFEDLSPEMKKALYDEGIIKNITTGRM